MPAAKGSARSARRARRTGPAPPSVPVKSPAAFSIFPSQAKKGSTEGSSGRERRSAKHHSTASRSVRVERGRPLPRRAETRRASDGSSERSRAERKTGQQEDSAKLPGKRSFSPALSMSRCSSVSPAAREAASSAFTLPEERQKTSRLPAVGAAAQEKAVNRSGSRRSAASPAQSRKDGKRFTPRERDQRAAGYAPSAWSFASSAATYSLSSL